MTFARPIVHGFQLLSTVISARSWVQSEVRNFISLNLATTEYRSPEGNAVFFTWEGYSNSQAIEVIKSSWFRKSYNVLYPKKGIHMMVCTGRVHYWAINYANEVH